MILQKYAGSQNPKQDMLSVKPGQVYQMNVLLDKMHQHVVREIMLMPVAWMVLQQEHAHLVAQGNPVIYSILLCYSKMIRELSLFNIWANPPRILLYQSQAGKRVCHKYR